MLNEPNSFAGIKTAKLLKVLKEEILQKWELLTREKIPSVKDESHLVLRNSLPQFLDHLIEKLSCKDLKSQIKKNLKSADDHAEDRLNQPGYTLKQVIYEYRILRQVIIDTLASKDSIDSHSLKIIHEFLDDGIQNTSVKYTELQAVSLANLARVEADKIEAERANEAKSLFLANMSHEIRTPLGAIMGFVELLHNSELTPKEITNFLSIIDRNALHLLRIIDDILDLAKVESGKMIIEKIEFSLFDFLIEFTSLAAFKAHENGVSFEFFAKTLVPEFIISDPTRLRQILTNMVSNAIKFTEKGRVDLTIEFADPILKLSVKDTGRGISLDQRSKLFLAFSQADSTTTRKYGGTGLGLALTKKICQALGGDFVLIDSELGKGSTFEADILISIPKETKFIPIKKTDKISTINQDIINNQNILKDFKVLVVEDSPDNQILIQLILTKVGAKVSLANDGFEGVESALTHDYDVILMDIQMPNMSGHEAVRKLRSKGYLIPIVALTAHAMREESERSILSGFSHFLTKPIDRKKLVELLVQIRSRQVLKL